MKTVQQTKSERARAMIKEGKTAQEIAATLGVTRQYVYNMKYAMSGKKAKARKAAKRISKFTGKPVRPYTKRKVEAPQPEIRYVQVDVPQPHYNLTWAQRFKALFTGRV